MLTMERHYVALRLVDPALFLQQEHRGSTRLKVPYAFVEHFNLLHKFFLVHLRRYCPDLLVACLG